MDSVPLCWPNQPTLYQRNFGESKEKFPCGTTSRRMLWYSGIVLSEILDACREVEKQMTIEKIYTKKLKPQLKTSQEYRGQKLTLKY